MQYRQSVTGSDYHFFMTGKFTFADHGIFKVIVEIIKEGEIGSVTLDMAGIETIDSAALGMLLIAREEAQKHNVHLILANPQGQIEKMFKVSKFETLFTIK